MLCEKCQQREATHHEFNVTVNCDERGVVPSASDTHTEGHLCDECYETSSPFAREVTAAWEAGCVYCGGEPIMTAPNLSSALLEEDKIVVLCERCGQEFFRCMNVKFPGLAEGSITPEQIAHLKATFSEIHEQMKKWVSERDGQ
jgi:protein-arginine kinase activator protein McsA